MHTGDEVFDSREFKEILNIYEQSVRSGQPVFMDADDLTDIADYYNFTGNAEKAKDVIEYALELNPGATSPLIFKAREAINGNDIKAAIEYAERIADKQDPEYFYIMAEIMIVQNKANDADKYLNDYFCNTDDEDEVCIICEIATLFLDYGLTGIAQKWINKTDGGNDRFYNETVAKMKLYTCDYIECIKYFNKLIDENPYSTKYWSGMASAQFLMEDYSNAITSCEFGLAIEPEHPDCLLTMANSLYRLDNFKEACKYFERYNKIISNDEYSMLNLSICHVNMKQYKKAIECLEKAEAIADSDSEYLVQIYQEFAFIYSALKMPDKAIEYIDKTDSLYCDHIDMEVLRGHILLENNEFEKAEQQFKKAIKASKNAPHILLRIVISLFDNQYVDLSYAMLKNLYDNIDKDFKEGYPYMALCCLELKKSEEFLSYLQKAIKASKEDTKAVLGHLFPKEMEPEEYYKFIKKQIDKNEFH